MDAVEVGKVTEEMLDLEMLAGVEVLKAVIWEVVEKAMAETKVKVTVAEVIAEVGNQDRVVTKAVEETEELEVKDSVKEVVFEAETQAMVAAVVEN